MPKSLTYTRLGASTRASAEIVSAGMLWGGLGGIVIGAGISLSIGLFYSSAMETIACIITFTGVIGALFGHVMAHLLADVDVSFLGRASSGAHHRIAGDRGQMMDLNDYQTLKSDASGLSKRELRDIMSSVRTSQ